MESGDVTKCMVTVASFLTLIVSGIYGIDSFVHVAVGLVLGAVWGVQIAQRFSPPPQSTSTPTASSMESPSG